MSSNSFKKFFAVIVGIIATVLIVVIATRSEHDDEE